MKIHLRPLGTSASGGQCFDQQLNKPKLFSTLEKAVIDHNNLISIH